MIIRTACGIDIHCLPDNARCMETGKSPLEMDECPISNFDDCGEYCLPELCEWYEESDEDYCGGEE